MLRGHLNSGEVEPNKTDLGPRSVVFTVIKLLPIGRQALSSWDLSRSVEFQGVLHISVYIILEAHHKIKRSFWSKMVLQDYSSQLAQDSGSHS